MKYHPSLFLFFGNCLLSIMNFLIFSTERLLGYKAEDLIDQSLKRFLATEHIDILERARQHCSKISLAAIENIVKLSIYLFLVLTQHYTTMHVMDLYTSNGDRLTFLCNIHMLVEGRRKAMKLGFLAQLIE